MKCSGIGGDSGARFVGSSENASWREARGMVLELGLARLEKAVRRVGRDPVDAARDSSSCCSWDGLCSLDDDAPISLARARARGASCEDGR